jgi:hypothetical protein
MRSNLRYYLLWAFLLAEGFSAISAISIGWLGVPWRGSIGDVLFIEGAVLLVAGGLIDVCRSPTFAHIRALSRSRIGDPPPRIRQPNRNYILLIAGLLLCLQGALLVYLFPASRG